MVRKVDTGMARDIVGEVRVLQGETNLNWVRLK